MDKSEQEAYEAVQAEKAALGITDTLEQEVTEPVEPTSTEPEPTVAPEVTEPKPDEVSEREPAPRDFKTYKAELRAEMQADYDSKVEKLREEFSKAKPNETKTENLEDEIKALATELEFDEAKVRRIVEVSRKGIETLSAEDKALLAEYKTDKVARQAEAEEKEQDAIFTQEWNQTLPSIKSQYPNATEAQIIAAKDKLDELAHSEKYHMTDMDYVLFKEKEAIGKILFSPKQATFESARPSAVQTETEEWPEISANMTPNQLNAAIKQRERITEGLGSEKVRITTRDDRGHMIERWE